MHLRGGRGAYPLTDVTYGEHMRARFFDVVNDSLKQSRSASESRRAVRHVVCSKNQPPLCLPIGIDDVFNRIEAVEALLDEERLQVIKVYDSVIKSLTATARAFEK